MFAAAIPAWLAPIIYCFRHQKPLFQIVNKLFALFFHNSSDRQQAAAVYNCSNAFEHDKSFIDLLLLKQWINETVLQDEYTRKLSPN